MHGVFVWPQIGPFPFFVLFLFLMITLLLLSLLMTHSLFSLDRKEEPKKAQVLAEKRLTLGRQILKLRTRFAQTA